jgi:hypothetical protein
MSIMADVRLLKLMKIEGAQLIVRGDGERKIF